MVVVCWKNDRIGGQNRIIFYPRILEKKELAFILKKYRRIESSEIGIYIQVCSLVHPP